MSDAQSRLDNDVAALTTVATDLANEWAAISALVKAQAPAVDTSKLDALVAQFQGLDTSWAQQLAPPAAS
jgi:hypothetical protein